MKERSLARWAVLLPIALLTLGFQAGRTTVVAAARAFPAFIAMPGVSARGVAVDKVGNVYVSVLENRSKLDYVQVRKYTPGGDLVFSVEIGQGTIGGLTVTANGELYIALAAGLDRGVYRMDRDGEIESLPGSNQIFFANGLAFDDVGNLWITESVSLPSGQGSIWLIPRDGVPQLCVRNDLLKGTGALGQPVPIGANGIAYYHGHLYVTNTEKGTVLRLPVSPDGGFGDLEVWTTLKEVPESPLAGPSSPAVMGDGIALDVYGNLFVVALTRSAIVRLDLADKSQHTVAVFRVPASLPLSAKLDFPASAFFGTGMGERTSLFVTNSGLGKGVVPQLPWAGSSVVKIDAGVPGRPIH